MNILDKIKQDIDAARKARDAGKLSILTLLYAEASKVGKNNGNRESTDAEVVSVVKKLIEANAEILKHKQNLAVEAEQVVLKQYLPSQLNEHDLTNLIQEIVRQEKLTAPKGLGVLMKILKDQYGGQYDGGLASKIAKEVMQ